MRPASSSVLSVLYSSLRGDHRGYAHLAAIPWAIVKAHKRLAASYGSGPTPTVVHERSLMGESQQSETFRAARGAAWTLSPGKVYG